MHFNNSNRSKRKSFSLEGTINLKQHTIDELYQTAQNSYLKLSESQRDKWNSIISTVGTKKDKVSMMAAEVIKNPHTCLDKIEELVKWCFDKSHHFAIDSCHALVNIFDQYVFADKNVLKPFVQSVQQHIKKHHKDCSVPLSDLVAFYIEHHIKQFYGEFVKSIENLLTSTVSFVKKQAIKMLTSLTKHGQLRRMIINTLINKFGDSDREIVNQIYKALKQQFYQDLQSSSILLQEAKMLIFRQNISKKTQFYVINLLNNLNMKFFNEKGIQKLFQLYYHFFEKLMADQSQKGSISSRLFLNSIKGLNKIFSFIKGGSKQIKDLISSKIENVYKIVHKTTNTKAKIQLYLFLFQYHSHIHGSLTDRYYRSLYDFIKNDEVLSSSLAEVFFDLLLISIKEDQNLARKLAFIKRILQVTFSAQANFIATTLLMLNNVLQEDESIKIKIHQKQHEMDDDTEEKVQKYDMTKREPIYAGAQNVLIWELTVLNNHYHPTIRKYAQHLLKGEPITYEGQNPLLQLSSSNFLEKLVLKKEKKSEAWMLKMKKHLKKIRSAKYESLVSKKQTDFKADEEFIKKYLKLRNNIHTNFKKKQETDIQQFADKVIENQMNRLNPKDQDIQFSDDEDLQMEEGSQQQQEFQNQENQEFGSDNELENEDGQNQEQFDQENQEQMGSFQEDNEDQSQAQKSFQQAFEEINNDSFQYMDKPKRKGGNKSKQINKNMHGKQRKGNKMPNKKRYKR